MTWLHLAAFGKTCHASFATDASAFLSHRTFHQQHHGHQHHRHHGQHEKDIEISKCRCLLLAQILECSPGELLRSNRIAGLLQKHSSSLLQEGTNSGDTLPPSLRSSLNNPTAAPRSNGGVYR